jgi:hypothetical protein
VRPGEIHRHSAFYRNSETGELEPKFLVALARTPGDDIVARLLTSRPHARPEDPPCFHGMPYPGFYLGVLGGPLSTKSWLDLRYLDDLDSVDAMRLQKNGVLNLVMVLEVNAFTDVLACAAGADDTTLFQERCIRDELAKLRR